MVLECVCPDDLRFVLSGLCFVVCGLSYLSYSVFLSTGWREGSVMFLSPRLFVLLLLTYWVGK